MYWYITAAVFGIMSLVAIVLTVYDKIAAKCGKRRIPEKVLMLTGLFCGAEAELLTMLLIRHKTKHMKFIIGLPLFIVLHAASVFSIYYFYLK